MICPFHARVDWGILKSCSREEKHVTYVWFDASSMTAGLRRGLPEAKAELAYRLAQCLPHAGQGHHPLPDLSWPCSWPSWRGAATESTFSARPLQGWCATRRPGRGEKMSSSRNAGLRYRRDWTFLGVMRSDVARRETPGPSAFRMEQVHNADYNSWGHLKVLAHQHEREVL